MKQDPLDIFTDKNEFMRLLREADRKQGGMRFVPEELKAHLKSQLIGQDHVADHVVDQLERRLLISDKNRTKPLGVFCLAGPPGVGKTYFAKLLAEKLFGSKDYAQFFSMQDFSSRDAVVRVVGAPKVYSNSGPGLVTKALKQFPSCIIILDEIEKACEEVHLCFLNAWNDGFIEDVYLNQRISTKGALFILTSNVAQEEIGQLEQRYAGNPDEVFSQAKELFVQAGFKREIVDRMDYIFGFSKLVGADLARVAALEIKQMLASYEISLQKIDSQILVDVVTKASRDPSGSGVRDVRRSIERSLGSEIIRAKRERAKSVNLVADNGSIRIEILEKEAET